MIGFNSQYLLDFLKAATGGEVRFEFKDAQIGRPVASGREWRRGVQVPVHHHADADLTTAARIQRKTFKK